MISKGSPGTFKFNGTLTFIDDLCTINDDSEFFSSYKYIYPKQLELKLEHQEEHATFLDLDITVANNIFVYKLFDERGKFPFIVVRMPYLSSNIPSSIFYGSIFFNWVPTNSSMCTKTDRFCAQCISIIHIMITQSGNKESIYPTSDEKTF